MAGPLTTCRLSTVPVLEMVATSTTMPEMGISGFKQSGIGRELGRHGFDEYSHMKSVYVMLEQDQPWVR